jgi:hypothetical protein
MHGALGGDHVLAAMAWLLVRTAAVRAMRLPAVAAEVRDRSILSIVFPQLR